MVGRKFLPANSVPENLSCPQSRAGTIFLIDRAEHHPAYYYQALTDWHGVC
jgi:hypothetical protein